MREDLENRVQKIRAASGNSSHRPSVLISIDRVRGTGKVSDIYAAGNNPYFNEILEIVGARNILQDSSSPVPTISAEGILELNPEFVIDLTTTAED
ncbi:MAG: hypothetical protein IKW74_03830, partial [Thermoguttaceae bacterium]|nr:hypothetical protein [Thermoguttaceae bacterium]